MSYIKSNEKDVDKWFNSLFKRLPKSSGKRRGGRYISIYSGKSFVKPYSTKKIKFTNDSACEVVVRITSRNQSGTTIGKIKSHLDYISRNGKLEMVDEEGNSISSKDVIKKWKDETDLKNNGEEDKKALNIVLSMPKGTDRNRFKEAISNFTEKNLYNHNYVLVFHNDTEQPHAHVCLRTVDKDGNKIRINKEDIQQLRVNLAIDLNAQGVLAKATDFNKIRRTKNKKQNIAQYYIKKREQEKKNAYPIREN